MQFKAIATDYDGTLACDGRVANATLAALRKWKHGGRRLILVTGRELDHLREAFPEFAIFDHIVAENGAVVFDPATEEKRVIGDAPPKRFVALLRERGVDPLSVGESVVATWEPHENTVLDAIRELGLELQIIFNKGAIMILPPGVNKGAGLAAALEELELSPHNVVGVGDAENDFSFMRLCGCAAARAGVVELIDRVTRDEAGLIRSERHGIRLGVDHFGNEVLLTPHRGGVLITGGSGVGKSTIAKALTEHMAEHGFEFCVFDPEGDYNELEHARHRQGHGTRFGSSRSGSQRESLFCGIARAHKGGDQSPLCGAGAIRGRPPATIRQSWRSRAFRGGAN